MSVPSDAELVALISRTTQADVAMRARRPYPYATSASLEELIVTIGGHEHTLIFKDSSRHRLLDDAQRTKPRWLHEPRREIVTYERILAPAGVGPRVFGADAARAWLVLERVNGVELWQIGELEVWEAVAGWLARFHARFADRAADVQELNSFLLDFDRRWFEEWADRAAKALAESDDARARLLLDRLDGYGAVAVALARLPRTFVHGELYPSNLLVAEGDDVYPIDWEMAGIGPGLVDLAALTAGWGPVERDRLVSAYEAGGPPGGLDPADLDRCRLHLAFQWMGWAAGWDPPLEHAHDWIGEAVALTATLGIA